jgi:glyoxylase-like metal-dependent hydrolase (beta-lactamase superfamily II)
MVEGLGRGIYRIELPIPIESLKSVNVYIVMKERPLLIDTGMNAKECVDALFHALEELGVDESGLDVFVTHFHIDHFGNAKTFLERGASLYISEEDWNSVDRLKSGLLRKEILEFLERGGYVGEDPSTLFSREIDLAYEIEKSESVVFVRQGDIIRCDDSQFECISTPGHTPGHMTLLLRQSGFYFSGDHLLYRISPTVQARSDADNPLKDYLLSLKKVSDLPITLVLPAHGPIFEDAERRIQELLRHHRVRLAEILSILACGQKTTCEIASLMSWDIGERDWAAFPLAQKLFAMGEAFAHLKYLEEQGLVGCRRDKVYRWSLSTSSAKSPSP